MPPLAQNEILVHARQFNPILSANDVTSGRYRIQPTAALARNWLLITPLRAPILVRFSGCGYEGWPITKCVPESIYLFRGIHTFFPSNSRWRCGRCPVPYVII